MLEVSHPVAFLDFQADQEANDMAENYQVSTAHLRLATLIDRIFQVVPNVAIVVSTLLPNADPATQANIQAFNSNLPGVVAARVAVGKKIVLVDMSSDWFSKADLHADGTHPLDEGYLKMAKVFYNGVVSLSAQISAPLSVHGVNDDAAVNDVGAGTALVAICQTAGEQTIPSAQVVQCGLNLATTSATPPETAASSTPLALTTSPTPSKPPGNNAPVPQVTGATSSVESSIVTTSVVSSTSDSSVAPSPATSTSSSTRDTFSRTTSSALKSTSLLSTSVRLILLLFFVSVHVLLFLVPIGKILVK